MKLGVRATGKAKRRLRDKGEANVEIEATFTPDSADPYSESEKLKLVRR